MKRVGKATMLICDEHAILKGFLRVAFVSRRRRLYPHRCTVFHSALRSRRYEVLWQDAQHFIGREVILVGLFSYVHELKCFLLGCLFS